jgi:hypothetical protein
MTSFNFEYNSTWISSPGYLTCKVPEIVRQELSQTLDNLKSDKDPFCMFLVGHNEKEYKLPITPNLKYLTESLSKEYEKVFGINLFDVFDLDNCDQDYDFNLSRVWVNYSKKYNFNPIHNHTGVFSFVIWVKIPYNLDDEFKVYSDSVNDNENATSLFEFTTIDAFGRMNNEKIKVDKSYEWNMMFFPSQMMHQVYPFYTSDEFRVSISGNVYFSVKGKDEV